MDEQAEGGRDIQNDGWISRQRDRLICRKIEVCTDK
jgi:hypothetical protein